MNKTQRHFKLTALFTILFILLLLLGNCLIILKYRTAAVVAFLAAFLCVAGQMMSLAKFLRQKQLNAAIRAQATQKNEAATSEAASEKEMP